MKITVIETPRSAKGLFAVVYAFATWPERTLRHRGWLNARVIYERPATSDEIQELQDSYRYLAFRYRDWDALVADEFKYGIDANAHKPRFWAPSISAKS